MHLIHFNGYTVNTNCVFFIPSVICTMVNVFDSSLIKDFFSLSFWKYQYLTDTNILPLKDQYIQDSSFWMVWVSWFFFLQKIFECIVLYVLFFFNFKLIFWHNSIYSKSKSSLISSISTKTVVTQSPLVGLFI